MIEMEVAHPGSGVSREELPVAVDEIFGDAPGAAVVGVLAEHAVAQIAQRPA